jgi:IS5 family transposase
MSKKSTYKVKNWKAYNRSLIDRGNLTLWISDDVMAGWMNSHKNGRRGRDQTYSDAAIQCALTLRSLLHLTLRQTQGFFEGLISLLKIQLPIPCYTTLSRRVAGLDIDLQYLASKKAVDIVIDATGLKVYGEGEWKVRVHGKDKRRTWRKLHVAIDAKTQEICSLSLTLSNVHDSKQTKDLLAPLENLGSVTGDKGYDNCNAYDPIAAKGALAIIPPRSGAAIKKKNLSWGDVERNRLITEKRFWGKNDWKKVSGYHRRSLAETGIFRYKRIIGGSLHARKLANQQQEVRIGAMILNKMTQLGMPDSYKS